ncbi:putative potassium efflux transporter (plasmid) [Sinorhizobium fredii HH103]|uniref:Potassium efflux transporter n=1 Tax=Sinorhizobium fredii (strain HH103) TaxID=1117943 RepID=G9AI43_SINF1|nr:YbaL family putative K(+) efflux transporter [Sinorhizobium fredii]CCF00725.1 putative potassium efflux transporter [Sinorhizobium fredii HH103]
MPQTPLIATIVAAIGLAFVLGTLANRLRLSPLVGYLVAGVLIGPFTPGFVADQALARLLAELGVILLLFGIGLQFSLDDLLPVKTIAFVGAVGQMAVVTVLGLVLAQIIGWSVETGVVFGLALSVASTVVVLRTLQDKRLLATAQGRIAVGWLIVQDLAVILTLILLPAFAAVLGGGGNGTITNDNDAFVFLQPHTIAGALTLTLGKFTAFFAVMLLVGRRVVPWVLHYAAHTGSRELFRLAVLAIALGVAFGAATLFDVSFALGAFFAGMILAESQLSQRAAQETLPLRDAFAVLFFVSVGMLFDPMILWREPLLVGAVLLIIVIGNAAAVSAIALMFRRSIQVAFTLGVSLSQIGEFSFILAGLGVDLELLPEAGRDLILAGAILSILANPLLFVVRDRLAPRLEATEPAGIAQRTEAPDHAEPPVTKLTGHAVLVGHGRVGSLVAETLAGAGVPYLVIEERQVTVDQLRARKIEVIAGNAAQPGLLEAANVAAARWLISAIPNPFESGNLIEQAHATNSALEIIARAHSDAEVDYLKKCGASLIIMVEREIARGISEYILSKISTATAAKAEHEASPSRTAIGQHTDADR